jgi:uroporphyrinogen-III decarboxylase
MNPCLDFLVEAGFTGMWPLEVNSGMDARVIRKKYGNRLFLAGNLDKRELAKGGEAMRREIESKLPVLKETSGYIPGADHLIGIEFTYDKFKEYAAYVKTQLEY